ncbi:uncharacterized protein LOC117640259 [Thrips palmi]|uniref:Uncharacterized protein LOC117640259 n=1 Tax=Thrips palmi TaxID=161013 RepID=A0A6P8Y8Q2_THRPL|nr:uncharacterized protein LOC117640259 [Thrips palmi]XP_034232501.1 uncharacterized protein LOC117640259 [Thrips palmi]
MDTPQFIVNDNPVKLHHLCRMCATPCTKSVPIFGPVGTENELAIKFNNYLPLKVSESDSIPLQLCYECTNLLMQWDAAILVAVAADKKLRALLWRERQSQEVSMKEKEETQQPVQLRKRKRSSARVQESLCCSVCNKSGMDFRELVEHLKTHEDRGKESSSPQNSSSVQVTDRGDSDCSIDDLLTPVVCLETLDSERQLRSNKSNSGSPQEKTDSSNNNKKKAKRGRPKRVTRSYQNFLTEVVEGDVNDLLVTSSTPHNKTPETSEGDNTHSSPANNLAKASSDTAASTGCNTKKEVASDSHNNTFKPKVRIISAESINQTLEERAKANQTARSLESYQPDVLITGSSPPSGSLSPTKPAVRRLVLSGQVVKGINLDAAKSGQKFLKLSDGRIIKIIQNPNSSATLAPSGQRVQVLSSKVIGSDNDKPASQLRPISPDALEYVGSQAQLQPDDPPRSLVVRQMRRVGNRTFYFSCQPGPRHCPNRYVCEFCCKRNLTPESLQEHSELHVSSSDNLLSN